MPLPTSLVVKKGSKIRERIASGDARAGVLELDADAVRVGSVRTMILPPFSSTSQAFISRFRKTWFSCPG